MHNVELKARYQLFIGGRWKDSSDGRTFKTYCPADGSVLAECAEAAKEDVDEAVKAADVELISMEASRDSKGGAGCGTLFYIGANDVSDARHAVENALEQLPKQFGEVYVNDAGHLSFSYTARAGQCCVKTLGAVEGKAFGIICCGPAAIGCLVSDLAVKSAPVTVIGYHHPLDNCFANEVVLCFTGESAAVRQALRTAIHAGKQLLGSLGEEPHSLGNPWI